ncbi:MAG: electron transfer flavoprotein subunit beta/FixA family protein [Synergistaceae bacterium]|jgi:electron transfer flavoprotein beta subunit|nr:electron transfer flavoprotein subunit beta/FixA family protein [Synergistaceae bacterium]
MRVTILMKQVPDTDEVKMDPESGAMIRDGAGVIVNPLDLNALEAAMAIRSDGDSVSVVSMGPQRAEESLRECLALGADDAVLATDRMFAGGDSWATAKVLVAVIEKMGRPDLIITGEKATDGETGQVGPEVAALLGIPVATRVTRLERVSGGIEFDCTLEDGILTQRSSLPILVTVQSDINALPLPTLGGKKRAYTEEIKIETASSLGLGQGETGLGASPTRVVKIETPKVTRDAEKFMASRPDELESAVERIMQILSDNAIL